MSGTLIQSQPSAERGSESRNDVWRAIAICGFLALAVILVFSRTLSQGFSNIDDPLLVYSEPHVSGGLTWSGIAWAFTSGPQGEWYPLSMLSHMLDCQLYGLWPAGHHLTNVLLHAASAVALFLVWWRMTGALWPSALVAALFALHPLRVESVAWIAERRDVLSGLFFMLTLAAYGEYVRRPRSLMRYLALVGMFAMGLMSKPMLVTLPAVLLLLDFWPLGRFGHTPPDAAARPAAFPWGVVVEKLPLFALSILVAVVTMLTHNPWHVPIPLSERLANGAIACAAYLGQLLVPVGLSPFYSHPEAGWPAWQIVASTLVLLAITAAAVIGRRSYPYFFVGWFWYVGMLIPVLGLTYAGAESRADRYTYLPQIGLIIALVWGAMRLAASWPARRWVFGVGSVLALAALMACTWRQTGFWQDAKTLWAHALDCDPKNVSARYSLGFAYIDVDEKEAAAAYRQVLETNPNERNIYRIVRARACDGLGTLAARKGDVSGAMAFYQQALELDPDLVLAHMNLAGILASQGKFDEAEAHYQRCLEVTPGDPVIYCNRGVALVQSGKVDEAIAGYRKALELNSNLPLVHSNLASLLAEREQVDEAISHFRRAIQIDPGAVDPYIRLARLLRQQGKTSEAANFDEHGRKASRRYAEAQNLRGAELVGQGRTREAIGQFQAAIAAAPDYAQAHCNLADALASQGNIDDAVTHYRRALEIDSQLEPARQNLERLLHR